MKKLFTTLFAASLASLASAQCTQLFFSEYVEGDGNDKALEIYNPTSQPISLSGYFIRRYSNGSTSYTAGGELALTGTIAPHDVWVITNGQTAPATNPPSPAASPALQLLADQLDGAYPAPTYVNGDDAIALEFGTTLIDLFGKIGEDPGTAWTNEFPYTGTQGTWITRDHTLRRKSSVTNGIAASPDFFDPMAEYDTLAVNTWDGLGSHTCVCFTGINEVSKQFVSVFPNPANNNDVTLSTNNKVSHVELIDRSGKLVASFVNENTTAVGMRFSTIGLAEGLYIVKAYMDKNAIGYSKLSIN
jgi:hypothetical protein